MSDYAFEGPKWTTPVVTWSFAAAGGSFSAAIGAAYQDIIREAIDRWSQVTNLTIEEVSDSTPGVDVRVGWGVFSGSQIGETDYAYQSSPTETFVPGTTVRLEDPSAKPVGTAPGSTYQGTSTTLFEVILHEFGHSLGLDHSTDPMSIMYPSLSAANAMLDASDIAGIQLLYGTPAGQAVAAGPSATPPTPSPIPMASGQVAVYRFFDTINGAQFLTGSTAERDGLIQTRPDLTYEGFGLPGIAPGATDPNAVPVYRFFESATGTHLFTTSDTERAAIAATRPDLVAEASTFSEHLTQQPGDSAVYRFFESTDGTHFYTASATERASLAASRPDLVYEGVAFYAPAPASQT